MAPYSRPKPGDDAYYDRLKVERRIGRRAAKIDPTGKTVTLERPHRTSGKWVTRYAEEMHLGRRDKYNVKEGVTSFLERRPPRFTDRVSDGLPDILPDWTTPDFS